MVTRVLPTVPVLVRQESLLANVSAADYGDQAPIMHPSMPLAYPPLSPPHTPRCPPIGQVMPTSPISP